MPRSPRHSPASARPARGPAEGPLQRLRLPLRPHSAFAHQTGLGIDHEPDAVLIFEPVEEGTGDNGSNHEVTCTSVRWLAGHHRVLRRRPLWRVLFGPRPTLKGVLRTLGIRTRDLSELEVAITKNAGETRAWVV